MTDTIKQLQEVRDSILSEIDGGEECRGWDSQLTQWAASLDAVIAGKQKAEKRLLGEG